MTKAKLEKKFDEIVSFPLYNAKFKEHYLANIWSDSFGYAGTEMIRRVVGDAKVQELNDVTDPVLKIPMERALIATGIQLIMRRAALATGSELVEIFEDVMEAY